MTWVLAGVLLLGLFLLLARWYVTAEPRDVLKVLRVLGIIFALVVIGLAIASGRLGMLWLVLLGLLPWMGRLRALNRQAADLRGPAKGQHIDRRTDFVVVYLNRDTGDMDGRVLQGPQAGKLLSELSIDALITLYEAASLEDPESAAILEAYLDRMHGVQWREKSKIADAAELPHDGPALLEQSMSRADAYAALGLQPGAPKSEIERAVQEMVETGHPDPAKAEEIIAKARRAKAILIEE
ncbi:MAG TPA: hypothetical protein DCS82_12475 [Rhodospirillaceae bacterium]|nr:hypothetical protein [Rhodospirillaceae bacterium]HAA91239.1 hypothetical protein [Rhodospirillaceae bacterium]HAT36522.1 hypothetical protein [Rhodospirillaceae bacterium]